MKIRAEQPILSLPKGPLATLKELRIKRNFHVKEYVDAKIIALTDYLQQYGLDTLVIGISGGIDSTVVAGLTKLAMDNQRELDNQRRIKKIELLSIIAGQQQGVTGQEGVQRKAQLVANWLGLPLKVIQIDHSFGVAKQTIEQSLNQLASPWAAGQGVAIFRTFVLYQSVSLLIDAGYKPLVLGTTNKDEGSYLGYVGKASDGMVDLQIISDVHKSEVYQIAKYLGVPQEIIEATPTGDMFDACPDIEVFGAPYEAVELLTLATKLRRPATWQAKQAQWTMEEREQWQIMETNLHNLHRYNEHKYHVGSPAFALNIMDAAVIGGSEGAIVAPYQPGETSKTDRSVETTMPSRERLRWINEEPTKQLPEKNNSSIIQLQQLLTSSGLVTIKERLEKSPWQEADQHGNWRGGVIVGEAKEIYRNDKLGSWRCTWEDQEFANALWQTIQPQTQPFIASHCPIKDGYEIYPGSVWRVIGVAPLFRAILYPEGSLLYPHYDAPFIYSQVKQTLLSLLICIEPAKQGGETQFIAEKTILNQTNSNQKDFTDWEREPNNDEIITSVKLQAGDALVFPHRLLHHGNVVSQGRKIILRSDIIAQRVGVDRGR